MTRNVTRATKSGQKVQKMGPESVGYPLCEVTPRVGINIIRIGQ